MIAVYTFKEHGLLSPIAHDLRLSLGKYDLDVEGDRVTLVCDPATLKVDGAVHGGRVDPMSAHDRADIEATVRDRILRVRQYPTIRFTGTRAGDTVTGTLEMVGRAQPIRFDAAGGKGEVELVPSRWGIAPYKAMLGALRLQDRVVIRFELPGTA